MSEAEYFLRTIFFFAFLATSISSFEFNAVCYHQSSRLSNLLDIRRPDVVTAKRQPHDAALFARKASDADALHRVRES
jgi:hypothetical protein